MELATHEHEAGRKGQRALGVAMNALLKEQMCATARDAYFSDPGTYVIR